MCEVFRRCLHWGIIVLCAVADAQLTTMPLWFQQIPTDSSCIYSVGIANRYSNDHDSFMAARDDGVGNLIRAYKVHIRSGLAQYVEGATIGVKTFITEEIDSILYKKIDDYSVVLDSLLTSKQAIVLVGWTEEYSLTSEPCAIPQRFDTINTNHTKLPDWVQSTPQKSGYIYGVGMSKAYSHLARSWNESAKNGRQEIAKQIHISQSTLEYHYDSGGDFEKSWMEEVVDVTLKGAMVTKRWYDTERKIYYTLVEYGIPK